MLTTQTLEMLTNLVQTRMAVLSSGGVKATC